MKLIMEHDGKNSGDLNDNLELLDVLHILNTESDEILKLEEYFNDTLTLYTKGDKYCTFRTKEDVSGNVDGEIYEFDSVSEVEKYLKEVKGDNYEEEIEIQLPWKN